VILRRSLAYYRRSHIALACGVAVTTAVLVGSLLVGDIVRNSLRRIAEQRLGEVDVAVLSLGRFFHEDHASRLAGELGEDATIAPLLQLPATAATPDGSAMSRRVQLLGVAPAFWKMALQEPDVPGDGVVLNRQLAERLGVAVGDEMRLRIAKPSWLPRDAPGSSDRKNDRMIQYPASVAAVVDDDEMGRFSLAAEQAAPFNAYVPLDRLQAAYDEPGQVNVFLIAGDGIDDGRVQAAIDRVWRPIDVGYEVVEESVGGAELRSKGIFLRQESEVEPFADVAEPTFTYLVNTLAGGGDEVPYSMVSALRPSLFAAADGPAVPGDWPEEGALINTWLAERLGIGVGDDLRLAYYVYGDARDYREVDATVTVAGVIPIEGLAADPSLMPEFPGIHGKPSCRDCKPGIDIDPERFDDADEAYWDEHRGTPKAFLRLGKGRELWGHERFGATTSLRFPGKTADEVRELVRERLDPEDFGLQARPVRRTALAAVNNAMDFGGLFVGMSFFLIGGAMLLTVLLFALAIDHRRREIGLLLASGFTAKSVRRRLIVEVAVVAGLGSLVGAAAGVGYCRAIFAALTGPTFGAPVSGVDLVFSVSPGSLLGGLVGVWVLAVAVLSVALRRISREEVVDLLHGRSGGGGAHAPTRTWVKVLAIVGTLAGIGIAAAGPPDPAAMHRFFGAGAALLVGGIAAAVWYLRGLGVRRPPRPRGLAGLGTANASRRPGRSLAVIGILASATFLLVSTGAFHKQVPEAADERSAGTGGFAFFATSSLPVYADLDDPEVRREQGLRNLPEDVIVVPMRSDGDEASCLNLNRAQKPRLWAVDSQRMAELAPFTFAGVLEGDKGDTAAAWRSLRDCGPETVPAIIDLNTGIWALGYKGVGAEIDYVDAAGEKFQVRIVGMLNDSILQGGLLVDRDCYEERFPTHAGFDTFLIDAPPERADEVEEAFERRLRDEGMELESASVRLDRFFAVQNVYIAIFQILGGLGLLLGSLGLAIVLLRNVIERRGELALMRSIGFARGRIRGLLVIEHALLLGLGLGIGVVTAAVSILPVVLAPGEPIAFDVVLILVAATLAVGILAILLAAAWAMNRRPIEDLRSE